MLIALLIPLTLAGIVCMGVLTRAAIRQDAVPKAEGVVLGAVVSFFDTLGIGSFAPTAAWFKFRKLVPDKLIPQTMLVGLTPPSVLQGVIYLILLGVMVDPVLLVGCVLACVMGGLLGAPLVARSKVWVAGGAPERCALTKPIRIITYPTLGLKPAEASVASSSYFSLRLIRGKVCSMTTDSR